MERGGLCPIEVRVELTVQSTGLFTISLFQHSGNFRGRIITKCCRQELTGATDDMDMPLESREVTIAPCNSYNARSQMMHGNNNIGSCSSKREHVTHGL